jgi:O-antigen ligase
MSGRRSETMMTAMAALVSEPELDGTELSLESGGGKAPVAFGLPAADIVTLFGGFLVLVAYSTKTLAPVWTPRVLILLALVGPGVLVLGRLIKQRDRAAWILTAFLGWALIGALSSAAPFIAVVGEYSADTSWLFLVAFGCWWALGRRLTSRGVALLPAVLGCGLAVTALAGLAQLVVDVPALLPMSTSSRASGLTDNPIFLGGLMAGAVPLAVAQLRNRRWVPWALGVVLFTLVLNITGTRSALVCGLGSAVYAISRLPRRRLLAIGALVIGLGASVCIPNAATAGSRTSASVDAGSSASGMTPRVEAWRAAAEAIRARPLFGWGSGQFRHATQKELSLKFVLHEGIDHVYFYAHNAAIEYATTTGVVGLVLLAWWAVVVARRARGSLALFACAIAGTWLLEPAGLVTASVAMLALGAAHITGPRDQSVSSSRRYLVAAIAGAIGLVAGSYVLVADLALERAATAASTTAADRAQRMLPGDPTVADQRTRAYIVQALNSGLTNDRARAIEVGEAAVRLAPDRFWLWVRLGDLQRFWGSAPAAEASYHRALAEYPWAEGAWQGLADLAVRSGDRAGLATANEKLCEMRSPSCDKMTIDAG